MITWEEFKSDKIINADMIFENGIRYEKQDIACPKCGKAIYKNVTEVLATYPEQFYYECPNCGWHDYAYH